MYFFMLIIFLFFSGKPIIKWDLVNVAVFGLEKHIKSLGFVLMKDK